ncbi:MAG: ATP-binding protein [Candidatus Dependentiae bacterium]|nr:ATP-binding protein [Candidatus Dependentiae bacterium]
MPFLKTTIALLCIIIVNTTISQEQVLKQCKLSGMFGSQPTQICKNIIRFNYVKAPEQLGIKVKPWVNRILLHGKPGNGKTSIAHKIAELTNSELIHFDAPSLVNELQGSGAQAIADMFNDALTRINAGKSVVIFIDEIDAVASKNTPTNHQDTRNAMQKLWCKLLEHENEPNLFIIVATNIKDSLHATFNNRFPANNIIEIKNPDLEQRKEILKSCLIFGLTPTFNEHIIYRLQNAINQNFGNQHNNYFEEMLNILRTINKKIIKSSLSKETTNPELIKTPITQLEHKKNQFFTLNSTSLDKQPQELKNYFNAIDNYIKLVQKHLQYNKLFLNDKIIHDLAQKTDNLSIRSLIYLVENIIETALHNNNGTLIIDNNKVDKILETAKENERKDQQGWSEHERQKAQDLRTKIDLINSHIKNKCPHFSDNNPGWLWGSTTKENNACAQAIMKQYSYHLIEKDLNELLQCQSKKS